MTNQLARATLMLTATLASLWAGSLAAQDAVLSEFYGRGVHQYFAGNSSQAIEDLTASINGGSKDPRAYYFRALAELKVGQQGQATSDLMQGAALESADINQFYPVGKSLERVQGAARLSIERYRSVARAQAHQRQQQRDALRYEQRHRAEADVLRAPVVAPPVRRPAAPGVAAPPVPSPPGPVDDPFADKPDEQAPPAAAAEPEPADTAPADTAPSDTIPAEEPAAPEAPAEKSDSDDPFGEPPAKADEAGEMPAEQPAESPEAGAKGDDNPFADDK